jgi:hypothetical protein
MKWPKNFQAQKRLLKELSDKVWAEEYFLKELKEIGKGNINWELESLESHVERYKDKLDKNSSEKLKKAVIRGVRIQIEKLRKRDGDAYGISRAVEKYGLAEEGSMFKEAWKIYFTRSLEGYTNQLENDKADYNRRHWFVENINSVDLDLQKRFEKALEGYRERSGIKEYEDIDQITKKNGVDNWRWDNRKRKTLKLEMILPYYLCGGFGKKVSEKIAKKYAGKISYEPPYIPEDMSEPLTDERWYLEIPATKDNLEVLSKKAVKARDEMEKLTYRVEKKLIKAAIEPNQRSLNLY